MRKLIKEDDTHTCKFYESLDKLVKESQDRMQHDPVDGQIPVGAIVRTARFAADAADIILETVPAVGVAISRGVAAGLGSIGIAVDLGMMVFSIVDIAKGSNHKISPLLSKKIEKLENDLKIINAICYYVALHQIQLLLH